MNSVNCNPLCLVLGGIGAMMASLAELTAKGEVSTILRVKEALSTYLGISLEPVYIMLLFIFLGIVITFASQVNDLKKAIYVGASIITIFLTIIPNGLPPSIDTSSQEGTTSANGLRWATFSCVSEVLAQSVPKKKGEGKVQVSLYPKDGKRISEVVLTVREPSDGRILARSKFNSDRIILPQMSGRYQMVIEAKGYQAENREFNLTAGQTLPISVNLEPTWQPLQLQRIFRSY